MHTCEVVQKLIEAALENGRALQRSDDADQALQLAEAQITATEQDLNQAYQSVMSLMGCNLAPGVVN